MPPAKQTPPPADAPPEPAETPPPDAAQATAIATAVVAEMQRVSDAGGSRQEAETAASAEIQRQLEISEADADQIAEAVIRGLDARGVFEPEPAAPAAEPAAPAAGEQTPPAEPQAGQAAAPEEPAGEHPAEPAPRRPTFAERFMGKR